MFFKGANGIETIPQVRKPRFYIFCALILLGIFSGGFYSSVFSVGDKIAIVNQGEFLNLNSLTTQWLTINGHLNAISLIDGKIAVFDTE